MMDEIVELLERGFQEGRRLSIGILSLCIGQSLIL